MLNKTLLASSLLIALTGTVQAANPIEDSRTGAAARSATPSPGAGSASDSSGFSNDGSRSTKHGALSNATANQPSPGTGSASNPSGFSNDGSRSTKHGALSNATANQPASARSIDSDSEPRRFTNAGSRSTGGALSSDARTGANPDYARSARYSEYRGASSGYSARSSDFIGADVLSAENGSIGEIDDVIMSRSDNKLHAVIDVRGNTGDRLVSVPLDDLRMDSNEIVYLNMTEAQLQQRQPFGYNDGEFRGKERTMSRRAMILHTPPGQ